VASGALCLEAHKHCIHELLCVCRDVVADGRVLSRWTRPEKQAAPQVDYINEVTLCALHGILVVYRHGWWPLQVTVESEMGSLDFSVQIAAGQKLPMQVPQVSTHRSSCKNDQICSPYHKAQGLLRRGRAQNTASTTLGTAACFADLGSSEGFVCVVRVCSGLPRNRRRWQCHHRLCAFLCV
jgi:hypothetical protein